jgi:hypothetical protein
MVTSPNVEGTNDLTNSSRGSETPPWLYHAGPTMAARAWPKPSPRQLEDSVAIGFLLVLLLRLGDFLMNGWMWRLVEAEAINRQASRAKGGAEPSPEWVGPVGPGPFRPGSVPVSSPVASCMIPYLCALACGPLTSFPSRLRLGSLLCKLRCFLAESLKTCTLALRSSDHLESCSSRVLILVGLHDLRPKCLVNLSRKSPL